MAEREAHLAALSRQQDQISQLRAQINAWRTLNALHCDVIHYGMTRQQYAAMKSLVLYEAWGRPELYSGQRPADRVAGALGLTREALDAETFPIPTRRVCPD